MTIPAGLCQCGCGQPTTIATKTETAAGRIKGQPNRFLKGHVHRLAPKPIDYVVDPDSGCWIWQRQRDPNGYGRLRVNGRRGPNVAAHRVYYERARGPIPKGFEEVRLLRMDGLGNSGWTIKVVTDDPEPNALLRVARLTLDDESASTWTRLDSVKLLHRAHLDPKVAP